MACLIARTAWGTSPSRVVAFGTDVVFEFQGNQRKQGDTGDAQVVGSGNFVHGVKSRV